jgi:hypothetical protein
MKKNNSLKIFGLLAKRVYKISKKRKLGWKWQDAQKWTSKNLFQEYKKIPISKIKIKEVENTIFSIIDKKEIEIVVPEVCAYVSEIPTLDLLDINWWLLEEHITTRFSDDLKIRIALDNIVDTGIVKKSELSNLKQLVEDMRKQGLTSDDFIVFKKMKVPYSKDPENPCSSYLLVTLLGSITDIATEGEEEEMEVTQISDLPEEKIKEREERIKKAKEQRKKKETKKEIQKKPRPSKVEIKPEEEEKIDAKKLKEFRKLLNDMERRVDKGLMTRKQFIEQSTAIRKRLEKGGNV